MRDIAYILSAVKSRAMTNALSVLLTAFGVVLIFILLSVTQTIQNRVTSDDKNIDIVVGAKGSPLQIVLSSIYHLDIPTGNIPWDEAQKWMNHPQVKKSVPLALGDNWKGFRIVGTTPDYMIHYNATLESGDLWHQAFEAVVGADVPMNVGDEFNGAHGLVSGGHVHEDERYHVVGKLNPSGTVLDRLILTSLDSVLEIHGLEGVEDHTHHEDHEHDHGHEPEITALLLETKSPIANMNLPRLINQTSNLQAANPALEMVRLTSMLGLGAKTLAWISGVLIVIALLGVFSGMTSTLENRKSEMAVLRAIGYSRHRLFKMMIVEGLILTVTGVILGVALSVGALCVLSHIVTGFDFNMLILFTNYQVIVLLVGLPLVGILVSCLPAYRAANVSVSKELGKL